MFTITQTGLTTGVIVISGRVEGTDGASTIVSDDTFDGGRGSIAVVAPAAVTVLATHTTQPRVTVSQTGWDVRVVVANTGGAAVNLNLATSSIAFNSGTGWVVDPPTFLGSGNPLPGGGVDSLRFHIATTSSVAGSPRIDSSVPWQDVNNQTSTGTATTSTSGFGSIVVQTPVNLRISTTTSQSPNPAAVNTNQTFAVRVQVENVGAGHADVRDVALVLNTNGGSAITQIQPITLVTSGEIVTRDFTVKADGAPSANERFTSVINSVTDANSGQPATLQPPVDNFADIAIQNPAVLVVENVRPSRP